MSPPKWLETLSAVQAALLGLIGLATIVGGAAIKGWATLRKQMREMQDVPPDKPAQLPPDAPQQHPIDVLRERVAFLETQVRVERETAAELRARLTEIAGDHARTAAALNAEREHTEQLRTYVLELEQRRRETDSGYTRLAQSYPPTITEEDATVTPPRGTRRPR